MYVNKHPQIGLPGYHSFHVALSNVRVLTFGGECQTLDNISWRESAWPVCWII